MNATSPAAIQLVLAVGTVIAVVVVLYPTFLGWRWGEASRGWPSAAGTITYSGTLSLLSGGQGSATHRSYRPWVVCRYTVDNKTYKCRRIDFGFRFSTGRREAEKVASEFIVGQSIPVHYHPGRPGLATLRAGMAAGRLRSNLLYSAVLVGLLGIGWIWVMIHSA
jgi:hypothetical protein